MRTNGRGGGGPSRRSPLEVATFWKGSRTTLEHRPKPPARRAARRIEAGSLYWRLRCMTCPIPSKTATRGEIPQQPVQMVSPCRNESGESAPSYMVVASTCPSAVGPYCSLARQPLDCLGVLSPYPRLGIEPRRPQMRARRKRGEERVNSGSSSSRGSSNNQSNAAQMRARQVVAPAGLGVDTRAQSEACAIVSVAGR